MEENQPVGCHRSREWNGPSQTRLITGQEIERLKKEVENTRTLYRVMNKHNPRFGQNPSVKKFL